MKHKQPTKAELELATQELLQATAVEFLDVIIDMEKDGASMSIVLAGMALAVNKLMNTAPNEALRIWLRDIIVKSVSEEYTGPDSQLFSPVVH